MFTFTDREIYVFGCIIGLEFVAFLLLGVYDDYGILPDVS
jgi:hypothetical protein